MQATLVDPTEAARPRSAVSFRQSAEAIIATQAQYGRSSGMFSVSEWAFYMRRWPSGDEMGVVENNPACLRMEHRVMGGRAIYGLRLKAKASKELVG